MLMTCWANCDSPTFTVLLASRIKRVLGTLPKPFRRGCVTCTVRVDSSKGLKRLAGKFDGRAIVVESHLKLGAGAESLGVVEISDGIVSDQIRRDGTARWLQRLTPARKGLFTGVETLRDVALAR